MTPDQARAAVAALESKIASHETAISHLQDRLTAANRSVAIATNKITECVHAALRTAPEIRQTVQRPRQSSRKVERRFTKSHEFADR